MLYEVKRMLDAAPVSRPTTAAEPVIIRPPSDGKEFTVKREGNNVWRVRGKEIERIASMTYFEFDDSLMRFQTVLEKMGITAALTEAGVKVGDTVHSATWNWSGASNRPEREAQRQRFVSLRSSASLYFLNACPRRSRHAA